MSNIGIYINTLEYNDDIKNLMDAIQSLGRDSNVSVFYDNVGNFPVQTPCGLFSSTDIWNFSGSLILTDLKQVDLVLNVVNNIDVYYWYTRSQDNIFDLARLSTTLPIIASDKGSSDYIKRITGMQAVAVVEKYNLIELATVMGFSKELDNEHARI